MSWPKERPDSNPEPLKLTIDDILTHHPWRHPIEEHSVNLSERAALEFGNVEETANGRDRSQAAKHETDLALEIGLVGVDHVRDGEVHGDAEQSLCGSCEGGGAGAEGGCGRLTQDGEGHGADGSKVDESVNDGRGGLDPFCAAGRDDVHDAD